jgi:N-acetylglucosaminyldiphosphoundecaprenol N-acetyl-beta-D-mannosaminyltransferase
VLPASVLELASSCFAGDLDVAADRVVEHAASERGGYMCLCNVHVLTTALHDRELRAALTNAEIRFPDGEPVAWLLRRLGSAQARRIGGPDLLPCVIDQGRNVGLRHFFVGATERDLERVGRALVDRYPEAEIVGQHAPPHTLEPEVDAAIDKVLTSRAQVVWVGLGAPKQEFWMARAASALPGVTLIGVGAAVDFVGGAKRRAPAWMQRMGLEWSFRLASEPRRLSARYMRTNSEFVARTAVELARRRDGRSVDTRTRD